MNDTTRNGTAAEPQENTYDPETEIIMDILNRINAELDEIAEKLEEIGKVE
jgi:hypothetical protein